MRLRYRRIAFWLVVAAMAALIAVLVTAKARAAYAAYIRTDKSINMTNKTDKGAVALFAEGRTYEAKTPGASTGANGTPYFNDRRVISIQTTGPKVLDYAVTYVTPGNPNAESAQLTSGEEFAAYIGRDVSEYIAPGLEWREYSHGNQPATVPAPAVNTAEVEAAAVAAVRASGTPGTIESQRGETAVLAASLLSQTAGHTEGGGTGNTAQVTVAPAAAPTAERLATVQDLAFAAAAKAEASKSMEPNEDMASNATTEGLKDRAQKH